MPLPQRWLERPPSPSVVPASGPDLGPMRRKRPWPPIPAIPTSQTTRTRSLTSRDNPTSHRASRLICSGKPSLWRRLFPTPFSHYPPLRALALRKSFTSCFHRMRASFPRSPAPRLNRSRAAGSAGRSRSISSAASRCKALCQARWLLSSLAARSRSTMSITADTSMICRRGFRPCAARGERKDPGAPCAGVAAVPR